MMKRRQFLKRTSRAAAASAIGLPVVFEGRRARAGQGTLPDPAAFSLEEKVGQLVIARFPDWPLMEKYAREGIIGGLTPSLGNRSLADAAGFLNHFQEISKYPLLIGWAGHFGGGTALCLNQLMRLAATLCTFSDAVDSIEAAVRVLFGELKSRGKLPVRLSADYPFGLGL